MTDAAGWSRRELVGVGLALRMPGGWHVVRPGAGAVHLVAPDEGPERFRSTLTLQTRERVEDDGDDLTALVHRQLVVSSTVLEDMLLIDLERTTLAGLTALRARQHHAVGPQSVTLDQWFAWSVQRVIVVSCSSATESVAARRGDLAGMVAALEVLP